MVSKHGLKVGSCSDLHRKFDKLAFRVIGLECCKCRVERVGLVMDEVAYWPSLDSFQLRSQHISPRWANPAYDAIETQV